MIPFEFDKKSKEDRKIIVERYYEEVIARRKIEKIEKLENWCKKYLYNVNGESYTFKDIVSAEPDKLAVLVEFLEEKGLVHEKGKPDSHEMADLKYIKTTLYKEMDLDIKRRLMKSLGINVCPYCNHNYIYNDSGVNSCEYDHYYPQGRYYLLAVSFYNLIPVCHNCNKYKLEDLSFEFNPHNASISHDEVMNFKLWTLPEKNVNASNYKVELKAASEKYQSQIEILHLNAIYEHHIDIVDQLIKKLQMSPDSYCDKMAKQLNISVQKVKELAFETKLNPKEFGLMPMSKFKYDILNQLS